MSVNVQDIPYVWETPASDYPRAYLSRTLMDGLQSLVPDFQNLGDCQNGMPLLSVRYPCYQKDKIASLRGDFLVLKQKTQFAPAYFDKTASAFMNRLTYNRLRTSHSEDLTKRRLARRWDTLPVINQLLLANNLPAITVFDEGHCPEGTFRAFIPNNVIVVAGNMRPGAGEAVSLENPSGIKQWAILRRVAVLIGPGVLSTPEVSLIQ